MVVTKQWDIDFIDHFLFFLFGARVVFRNSSRPLLLCRLQCRLLESVGMSAIRAKVEKKEYFVFQLLDCRLSDCGKLFVVFLYVFCIFFNFCFYFTPDVV